MFLQRVAGPSRLPYRAVETVVRRSNSTSAPATEPSGDELADRDSRAAFSREKAIWASNEGYNRWKNTSGAQYKSVVRGQKAAWLGGHVVCRIWLGTVQHLTFSPTRPTRPFNLQPPSRTSYKPPSIAIYGHVPSARYPSSTISVKRG
jgi:hypothetical protein